MEALREADGDEQRIGRIKASLRAAIENPARLDFEAEPTEQWRLKEKFDEARREKRWDAAREFNRQALGWARLKQLEDRDGMLKLWEQQVRNGKMPPAEAQRRTSTLLNGTLKKAG